MIIKLKVQGAGGKQDTLQIEASSEIEALRVAMTRGLTVLSVEADQNAETDGVGNAAFPLLLFSQELLALLEAGLNLNEALTTLVAKERRPGVRGLLAEVLTALREGKSLSDVLGRLPQHFPEVYVATVRAAERTGDLPTALARYIAYQLQFDAIRKKVISALIYPLMLLVVGSFVILFLIGYVVPRFSVAYQSASREIPFASSVLLSVGQFIHGHWQISLMGLVMAITAAVIAGRKPYVRKRAIDWLIGMPWLAARADEFRLARLFGATSLLLSSGIPLVRALPMVGGMLSLEQQGRLRLAQQDIESGKPFSTSLVAYRLAGPVAESLLKVGERSGRLAEMLERSARFHDEEFARWMDWASKLLEPILMTVIGLVVGAVVVLMYLPIFELAGSLG